MNTLPNLTGLSLASLCAKPEEATACLQDLVAGVRELAATRELFLAFSEGELTRQSLEAKLAKMASDRKVGQLLERLALVDLAGTAPRFLGYAEAPEEAVC